MRPWAARLQAAVAGVPPEQVALLVSVGLVLGVFPIPGCPTALCLLAAVTLRLNAAALQLLNNVSTPLQLVLLLPLERVGACLWGGAASSSIAGKIGLAGMHAAAGWACVCVPAGVALYFALLHGFRQVVTEAAE